MKKPLTPQEMGKKGGTNRWKGKTKKQRIEAMKRVRNKLSPGM